MTGQIISPSAATTIIADVTDAAHHDKCTGRCKKTHLLLPPVEVRNIAIGMSIYQSVRSQISTRAQLSQRKGVMPNVVWYADIFGPIEVYNRMQKLSSCASVNAWCNFVTDRCRQIGVRAVAGMTPVTTRLNFTKFSVHFTRDRGSAPL